MKRIAKVLIANRGEIAVRIMRTCRELGIATVAVFSDADEHAPHVRMADEAVRIGPAPSLESYLVIDKIIAAARRTGADAVHPGFGFLSEREAFAEACAAAGLTFIGPTPAAIRAMGLKREAKEIAMQAGVPVVPGYNGRDQDVSLLAQKCREIGFPVLIKASAGGGGKGMRVCRSSEEVAQAIEGAKREALGAFGDDTLILEKYVENPRHIEFQILGDQHGNLLHLFERECSIQRRHQKIIEETPSTALTPELRAKMGNAAVAIGKAIAYSNAGTVEFIVGPGGEFYFLEVNTRLQVEHPITECVTGLDLVREQIRVAQGEALGYAQADLAQRGAAVECRIYAEDPRQQFLPQSGRLVAFDAPAGLEYLRIDSGIESGSEISIHYDPMIAKVITHGRDRNEATRRMVYALEQLNVLGVATNREFLIATLSHPEYQAGHIHTHFIEQHMAGVLSAKADAALLAEAAIGATLFAQATRRADALLPSIRTGFRNNRFADTSIAYSAGAERVEVSYADLGGGRFRARVAQAGADGWSGELRVISCDARGVVLEIDGVRRAQRVVAEGARTFVQLAGQSFVLREEPRFPEHEASVPQGACVAPMPGKVVKLEAEVGQRVAPGQRVLVMEAMKMEHSIVAATAGVVSEVLVRTAQQVEADQLLLVITADP
jgi:acetyl-CoA carboxylase biotin carboxylase subunit